jgi:hypothetical protein
VGEAFETEVELDATAFKYAPVVPSGLGVLVATMMGAVPPPPPLAQVVPDPVGFGIVLVLPVVEEFVAAVVPKFCVDVCPHPVVAKIIKAAQIAIAWNLKRDFATALSLTPEPLNP